MGLPVTGSSDPAAKPLDLAIQREQGSIDYWKMRCPQMRSKLKEIVPVNPGPLQITFAILVVLTLLVTACAPVSTPADVPPSAPTARPTSPPAPTPTSVPPTSTSPPAPTPTPVPPTPTPAPMLPPGWVRRPTPGWISYTGTSYAWGMAFDRDARMLIAAIKDDLANLLPVGPMPMVSGDTL